MLIILPTNGFQVKSFCRELVSSESGSQFMPWSDSLRRFIYLKNGAVSAPFRKVTVRHGSQGKIYLLTTNQMWLLETNPDLDMGKGISRLELQHAVFGQQLKCEAFQQCLQGSDAPRVIDVAVKLGRSTIEQRKEVFECPHPKRTV